MIPESVFTAIEHPTFSASLGVISTTHRLEAVLPRVPEVVELLRHLSFHGAAEELFLRADHLLSAEVPPDGPHPHDLPLAAYLWSLDLLSEHHARRLAQRMTLARGLWWSQVLASRILATPTTASDAAVSHGLHVLHAPSLTMVQQAATNSSSTILRSSRGPRLLSMTGRSIALGTDTQPLDCSVGQLATQDLTVRVATR